MEKMINLNDLESLSQKYYPFAYCLLPEELMATQLVIDSATKICAGTSPLERGEELENLFAQAIFELACSRQAHFKFQVEGEFFRLSLEQRAVLFLKEKEGWSTESISQVVGGRWENVFSNLNLARQRLLDMTGHFFDGMAS